MTPSSCQPQGCIVSKVEDFRRVLLDPNADRKAKQQALKFSVHFLHWQNDAPPPERAASGLIELPTSHQLR